MDPSASAHAEPTYGCACAGAQGKVVGGLWLTQGLPSSCNLTLSAGFLYFFRYDFAPVGHHVVDQAVIFGLLGAQKPVPIHVFGNFFRCLASMFCQYRV